MIGRVVSNKMTKSAVILVETKKRHPLYGKIFNRSKRFLVDDPIGVTEGDVVEVIKVKPISKNKHFQVKRILGKDLVALGEAALKAGAEKAIAEVLPEEPEKIEELVVIESAESVKEEKPKKKVKKEKI